MLSRPPVKWDSEEFEDIDLEQLADQLKPVISFSPKHMHQRTTIQVQKEGNTLLYQRNRNSLWGSPTGQHYYATEANNSIGGFDSGTEGSIYGEYYAQYPEVRQAVVDIESIADRFKRLRQHTLVRNFLFFFPIFF